MVALYFSHKVHNSCTSTEKANSIWVVKSFLDRFYFKINLFFFSTKKKSISIENNRVEEQLSSSRNYAHTYMQIVAFYKNHFAYEKNRFFFFLFFWTGKSRSIFPNLSSAPILCSKSDLMALKIVVWSVIQGDFSSILDNWQGSNLN